MYGMVSISTAALPCMSSRASIRKPPTPDLAALNEICAWLFAHDAGCERYMTEFLSYLSLMADVKVDGGKKVEPMCLSLEYPSGIHPVTSSFKFLR